MEPLNRNRANWLRVGFALGIPQRQWRCQLRGSVSQLRKIGLAGRRLPEA